MRHLWVSAATVIAITGAAATGNAQMQDKGPGQDKSPGSERAAPPSGGAQRAPGAAEKSQEPKAEPRRGAEREPGKDQPRSAQPQKEPQADKDRSKSATQPPRDQDKDQRRASEQRQRDQDQRKAAEDRQRGKDDRKAADQRKRDEDQRKATETKPEPGKDQQKSTEGPGQKQGDRVQVTEQQRTTVRERLVKEQRVERVNRTNINVSINVGARIPRSVRLHALPVAIVSLAPAYRSYSYFVLEDETICVVDPRTYVIVDVIPAGTQRADRPGRAQLALSPEDMRFIYRTVPKSRTADVRVRLALGAEVPRGVELIEFPAEVVDRVPDVRHYRYVVTENDVVIVDPNDHAVALVISE